MPPATILEFAALKSIKNFMRVGGRGRTLLMVKKYGIFADFVWLRTLMYFELYEFVLTFQTFIKVDFILV